MNVNHRNLITGLIATTLLCGTSIAETETAPTINFNMSIGFVSSVWSDSFGVAAGNSSLWHYSGQQSNSAGTIGYAVYADPDPVLGFDFSFSNDTQFTQTFNVFMTLPVTAWPGATTIGASIGASVTDANFDGIGMLSSVAGGPIFDGTIDGVSWLALLHDVNLDVPEAGGTSTIDDVDGLPGPSNEGPVAVNEYISISLTFDLSAGDHASFSGVFIVEYIPAPAGALAFLGLGLVGRRRRA